jgi:hypothetical protein
VRLGVMSGASFLEGVLAGVGASLLLLVGTVVVQVLEAWRFSRARGPLGALASVGRGWLHTRRDSDVVDAAAAALTGVALPCLAVAQVTVLGVSSTSSSLACALVLGAAGVPIVAALAGGPGSEARLALDDATRRAVRQALLVGAVLVAPGDFQIPLAFGAVVAMLRQRHEAPGGLQPRHDTALGAGTRLALDAADRAALLVLAWVCATGVVLAWPEARVAAWRGALLALTLVAVVLAAFLIVEWSGPQRPVARGLGGPLLWLAMSVTLRLVVVVAGLAAGAVATDAAGP